VKAVYPVHTVSIPRETGGGPEIDLKNAVTQTPVNSIALDRQIVTSMDHSVSHLLDDWKVTNQKKSGRCWLFAGLNLLRAGAAEKLGVKDFEFSQNYVLFWDKFERANFFLEAMIETADRDADDRTVAHLLSDPIGDGGQWNMFVALVRKIHRHDLDIAAQLTTGGLQKLRPVQHEVIVPISGIHRGVVCALQYAQSIATDKVQAVYVDFEEEATASLKDKWERWGAGVQLVVLPSPYRELTRPLVRYINRLAKENADEIITVVLPEFIPAKWWQHFLHNQSSLLLKGSLLFKKGVIVTSVPYHLEH